METKVCSSCGLEKDSTEFYRVPKGLKGQCKCCKLKQNKNWSEKNQKKIKEISKIWVEKNKDRIKENEKKWRISNKERIKLVKKEYREKNREKNREREKKYRQTEKYKEYRKKYREQNREKLLEQQRNRSEYYLNYRKKRYKEEIIYRLIDISKTRLREIIKIKNVKKNKKTFDIIGCTPQFLKEHIEKQFKDGMNWENYGLFGWHIDHIIPLSSAKTEEELYKLCHYTNLQPLWAEENMKKGNKILEPLNENKK